MQVICKALEPIMCDGQKIEAGDTFPIHHQRAQEMQAQGLVTINETPFLNTDEVQVAVSVNL